jgi:periplasmic divalent cation tolerance protein
VFELCEVTVTAADPDWLAALGANLVEAPLAATAQLTPIRVIYRSQERVCQHAGSCLTMHTRRSHVLAIVEHVSNGYPAELPGVVAVPSQTATPPTCGGCVDKPMPEHR